MKPKTVRTVPTVELALRILKRVWTHPANRGGRLRATSRALIWQIRRRLGSGPVTINAYGLELEFPRTSGSLSNLMYFGPRFEWSSIHFLERYVQEGDTVVDVGANIGLFTFAAVQQVGRRGTVLAFEPVGWAGKTLQGNVLQNDLMGVVELYEAAVGDAIGSVQFTEDLDVSNHVTFDGDRYSQTTIEVPMVTLDSVIEPHLSVDLVKLDVEGAEMKALMGMSGILNRRNPPVLLIEAHDHSLRDLGSSRAEVLGFLRDLGYSDWIYDVEERVLNTPPPAWNSDVVVVHGSQLDYVRDLISRKLSEHN